MKRIRRRRNDWLDVTSPGENRLPILDDPAVTDDQRRRWTRVRLRRRLMTTAIVASTLFMIPAVPALALSFLVGLFVDVTSTTMLLSGGVVLAAVSFAVATIGLELTHDEPPWDRIDTGNLSIRGRELVTASIKATRAAMSATSHGIGLTAVEVEIATTADMWRVASLCRDAERLASEAKEGRFTAAADTVRAMQRFADLAIAAANSDAGIQVENLSGGIEMEYGRLAIPETEVLGDLLDPR